MDSSVRAAIDIGTNSVKLLVAEVNGGQVRPLFEQSDQTRLGRGSYPTHRLQARAIEETARAVARFQRVAREYGAERIRVLATSAAREAVNQEDLLAAIPTHCGCGVEVLTGEQEAEWVFKGVTTDPALWNQPLLIVDVGGGSTELSLGHDSSVEFRSSFGLGTVRLLEELPLPEAPQAEDRLKFQERIRMAFDQSVRPALEPVLGHRQTLKMIATGGTATILARVQLSLDTFDRGKIDGAHLTLSDIRHQRDRLWSLPLTARRQIVGLPPNRADVILPGVLIYHQLLSQFHFDELRVSPRGLRYAAVLP